MFQLKNAPVSSHAAAVLFRSIVLLSPNGNFWILPLLHSASDMYLAFSCNNPVVFNISNEEEGMVSQNTTVIFGGAFYLG
jgi:hypothetical protein